MHSIMHVRDIYIYFYSADLSAQEQYLVDSPGFHGSLEDVLYLPDLAGFYDHGIEHGNECNPCPHGSFHHILHEFRYFFM